MDELLQLLKTWCDETYPDLVRVAIADFIGQSWKALTQLDSQTSLQTVWLMTVTLVQDVDEDVRSSMCLALQDKLMPVEESCVSVLCQQSTLRQLILLIPSTYEPRIAISLLKLLLETDYRPPMSHRQDPISSLLFKEDHANSYVESVLLLAYITEAFKELCRQTDELREVLKYELGPLIESFKYHSCEQSGHLQNTWSLDTSQCYREVALLIFFVEILTK